MGLFLAVVMAVKMVSEPAWASPMEVKTMDANGSKLVVACSATGPLSLRPKSTAEHGTSAKPFGAKMANTGLVLQMVLLGQTEPIVRSRYMFRQEERRLLYCRARLVEKFPTSTAVMTRGLPLEKHHPHLLSQRRSVQQLHHVVLNARTHRSIRTMLVLLYHLKSRV
jgi:hypothetical protein